MNNDSRRSFIKKSALLMGAAGVSTILPPAIQRALAINPAVGSTYMDAEHVVMVMLENRSFDHCFGTLKGVRGFDDPRAIKLPNGNPVWLQSNAAGKTYAPFRLNIHDTKSTWMGYLPHSRNSQIDAFNHAKFDKWLDCKRSPNKKYADMPLTLGYYNREDLPFNYAMADAFTICDQNFCSGNTSTHPNRLFYWTGTIRDPKDPTSKAYIRNPDLKTGKQPWKTFPERLEENGVSWKIYQNDLATGGGYQEDERAWLSNYNCNPLEFFPRYNVKFSERNIKSLQKQIETLPEEIEKLEKNVFLYDIHTENYVKTNSAIQIKKQILLEAKDEIEKFKQDNFKKLSQKEKNLYNSAFSTNHKDPDFREMEKITYKDGDQVRSYNAPKGDLFYQFRNDVDSGKLPTVSWMVAPHYFSDHPTKPMYGSWYISEILDILTKNQEVWKKTIFIVTYDENDGYFDHVPPFTPPDITKSNSGKCSKGIDPVPEYIRLEDELAMGVSKKDARGGPIGLGYRVPMLIASPWSRGGKVCSQVFDHTSHLMFLETFLNKKFNLNIKEENISEWRRTICGDLTSSFSAYLGEKNKLPFLKRDPFIEKIYNAQYKPLPAGFKSFSQDEIEQAKINPFKSAFLPKQEKGMSTSSPLPYELYVDGALSDDKKSFQLSMHAADNLFGKKASGSPFSIYVPGSFVSENGESEKMRNWQYAVSVGDTLTDGWNINAFEANRYHLRAYGPNGFYREFKGDKDDPSITIRGLYERSSNHNLQELTGNLSLSFDIADAKQLVVEITDSGYNTNTFKQKISSAQNVIAIKLEKSFGWYDFKIKIDGFPNFERHYAGRVETGRIGYTDPIIGRV